MGRTERTVLSEVHGRIEPEGGDQRRLGSGMLVGLDQNGAVRGGGKGRSRHGEAVAETPDAAHRAEVMVEGAVLLGEDDDMVDILERPGPAIGGDLERAGDGRRERRGGAGRRHQGSYETAAILRGHHGRVSILC
jgi:hypothetical protein